MAAPADTGVVVVATLLRVQPLAQKPLTNLLCEGAQPGTPPLTGSWGQKGAGGPSLHPSPTDLLAGWQIPCVLSLPLNRLHLQLGLASQLITAFGAG